MEEEEKKIRTDYPELIYQIALTKIEGVGDINAKKLLAALGSAKNILTAGMAQLCFDAGINENSARKIYSGIGAALQIAEKEYSLIEQNKVQTIFYTSPQYPHRLKHCPDSPVLLYGKWNCDLNARRVIGIVGTRKATDYGKNFCRKLIQDLVPYEPLIVSGLALGIDTCAHKEALEAGLPTLAVMGTGIDLLYPYSNKNMANKMLEKGGLITDYVHGTPPDKENFPKRNRIVAGLCDAIIVVEAGEKGGALITADIANSYTRDVFAVPGRLSDPYSSGCNRLIKTNRAALLESVNDLVYLLGWDQQTTSETRQKALFVDLTPDEEVLVEHLKNKGKLPIDELCYMSGISLSKAAGLLLNLEFNGLVKSLPGKVYELA